MIRTRFIAALLVVAAPLHQAGAQDNQFKTNYKFKSVSWSKGTGTAISGINNAGVGAGGFFYVLGGTRRCFILEGKTKTRLAHPKSVRYPECWDINNTGSLVGDYAAADGVVDGFIYDIATRKFTDIVPPGSVYTVVYGVNDSNVVIGYYDDKHYNSHGFIFDGTKYTTIDIKSGTDTEGWGINNAGDYTVSSVLPDGLDHSFLFSGGVRREIKFKGYPEVAAHHINNNGQLGATLVDSSGVEHGGVYDYVKDKRYVIDDPLAHDTIVDGINDQGSLSGRYDTSSGGPSIGFVATGKLD